MIECAFYLGIVWIIGFGIRELVTSRKDSKDDEWDWPRWDEE